MPRTYQQVADRARSAALNDAAKRRYSDPDLIGLAADGILVLRRDRPDLFIGQFSSLPGTTAPASTDNIPLPDEYFPALVDYVIARAHGRDAEDAAATLVPVFMGQFKDSI